MVHRVVAGSLAPMLRSTLMGQGFGSAMRVPAGHSARRVRGVLPALAWLCVVLYVAGAIGLPSLHLYRHRPDHDHRGGGVHRHAVYSRNLDHRHDAASDSLAAHSHEVPDALDESPCRAFSVCAASGARAAHARIVPAAEPSSLLGHASGSSAHFASAFLKAADVPPCIPCGLLWGWAPAPEPANRLHLAASALPLGARAPPA